LGGLDARRYWEPWLRRQASPGPRHQQGIGYLEEIVLEAVWLKHDGDLQKRAMLG
jgi:hypothetical protein